MKRLAQNLAMTFCVFAFHVTAIQACELHAGGNFGFGLGQLHPLAQQHYQASAFKNLSVKHVKYVDVAVDEVTTAKIAYVIPLRYRDVNVSFKGSDDVDITGESVISLEQDSGVYNLKFTVKRQGMSHISLQINGIKDGKPFSINQKIELRTA